MADDSAEPISKLLPSFELSEKIGRGALRIGNNHPAIRHLSMKPGLSLEESDVRAIVRLIADVHDIPGDHVAKKQALMAGLRDLIDADRWFWGLGFQPDSGRAPAYVCQL